NDTAKTAIDPSPCATSTPTSSIASRSPRAIWVASTRRSSKRRLPTRSTRAFTPWGDMEAELRARSLPLVSLESQRPLREFDVVGFSLQYELTFTNVLTMLDLGGISLRAADRDEAGTLVL